MTYHQPAKAHDPKIDRYQFIPSTMANMLNAPAFALNTLLTTLVAGSFYALGRHNHDGPTAPVQPVPTDILGPEEREALRALGALWSWLRGVTWLVWNAKMAIEHRVAFGVAALIFGFAIVGVGLRVYYVWHQRHLQGYMHGVLSLLGKSLVRSLQYLEGQQGLLLGLRDDVRAQMEAIDGITEVLVGRMGRMDGDLGLRSGGHQGQGNVVDGDVGDEEGEVGEGNHRTRVMRGLNGIADRVKASMQSDRPRPVVKLPPREAYEGEKEVVEDEADDEDEVWEDARDQDQVEDKD
ncbi:MAG: hypothetical protein M1831_000035 [Alyxoria varia]|nr:MAG: hypothetical protein M1831_000035 [Alyxoria varia]